MPSSADTNIAKQYFVTGIGTDVGKTVVCAILTKALEATYFKPIQSGILEGSDAETIRTLVKDVVLIPEIYRLKQPLSPHAAAQIDGVEIQLNELNLPNVTGNLIVEGAGGLMVPFDQIGNSYLELAKKWGLPVIVVSRHYLGSINHTLLTLDVLRTNDVQVAGVIFVGKENPSTEEIIVKRTGVHVIGRVPEVDDVDEAFVAEQAKIFSSSL